MKKVCPRRQKIEPKNANARADGDAVTLVGTYKERQLALVPKGRLKRLYAIENAVKASGALGISLATAIKYVRAGRGALVPCEMSVDASSWSRDYRKTILDSQADVDLMTSLYLAAAEKVYVPEIDFVELQLPQIEHLRYNARTMGIENSAMRSNSATEWHKRVMSLIRCISGWRIEDGICINRRRRIFGVMVSDNQRTNPVDFAIGIAIGCKGAKVYVVVGSDTGKNRLGRIPKAFRSFVDVVTDESFFNIAVGRESAHQELRSEIDDVRRKRKTEKEVS